ncbi:MAG TPA: class I SAM-dependent methyltransferase [Actinomycetota bacterium]|nr:class I SAM-dependent methyltransferase [Actinomycetota bacterium]
MTTTETEGQYLFPHSWEGEGDRLMALSALLDPVTKRHLAPLGLAPGWRCLEVGAGTGTIAGWLAEVVGEKGSVLATDLSLDLMEARGVEAENLELRRHDIINDPLPEGAFDLIHSRLVLEHLPARLDVLAKLSRALAPGGWLVLEDMCFRGQHATDRRGALSIGALFRAVSVLMRQHGHDPRWAPRIPKHMHRAGLTEIGAEGTQIMLIGAGPAVGFAQPSLARMRGLLLGEGDLPPSRFQKVLSAAPPLKGLLGRQIDRVEELLADPEFVYVIPTFVTAWGRRPLES